MSVVRYASPAWQRYLRDPPAWFLKHPRLSYIKRAAEASPPWPGNWKALKDLKKRCDELTKRHGIEYTMDHEIPLNHPRVCGLNVPANIRLVPRSVNAAKSNHWVYGHGELFGEPEQLRLWNSADPRES